LETGGRDDEGVHVEWEKSLCYGSGKVGEKRQFKDKRQQETKHKQEGFQDKWKGETVEKRKSPLSEGTDTAGKLHCGEGVGNGLGSGEPVLKGFIS
jgi:hypothetical protein